MKPNRLTVAEAAARLGLSPRRVRALIHAKTNPLPATREETPRGPVYWLKPADVDAWKALPSGRPRRLLEVQELQQEGDCSSEPETTDDE